MELLQLENIVKTQLQTRVFRELGSRYPKLSFSDEISDETASFPNVYIHELNPSEIGNSLENNVIKAIRDTIQIEVSTNTSKSDARVVINSCVKAMKEIGYSTSQMPVHTKLNNIYRFVIRCQRVVGEGDIF